MSFLKRRNQRKSAKQGTTAPAPTQEDANDIVSATPPPPTKAIKKEEEPQNDTMFVPLDAEPKGTSRQRGYLPEKKAALMRMQMQIADNIRQRFLAPDVSLDLPLESTPELGKIALEKIQQLIHSSGFRLPMEIPQEEFINNVMHEIFGFGPLQPLIDRHDITEIMVNGPYVIFVEKKGRLRETGRKFLDDDHVERIVKRIVLPLGRAASHDHPLIDARLPDGSRVNAVIRPCAIDGPNLTIRKFSKDKLTIDNLLEFGSVNEDMAKVLEAAVVSRRNIVVSGGTGSGKTTLINILSSFIPEHERTVTIEDAAELQLRQRNVVRLETKKPSPSSSTEVSIRDCVVNALRMRPERIVVGECRNAEALDMLQAMNTGHDGSMTTIHANTPRDCMSRIETLVLMAGVDLPLMSVRKQIASAIHMVVQASRLRDGSRKVTHITEILGMEGETIIMQDIYKFFDEGDGPDGKIKGKHGPTGVRPQNDATFRQYGFNFPGMMFMKKITP